MDRNRTNTKSEEKIDRTLCKVYQKMLPEDVPDRLANLLQSLPDQDAHHG